MSSDGVIHLFWANLLNLFLRQRRVLIQFDTIIMVHVVFEIDAPVDLEAVEFARREADIEGVVHVTRRRIVLHVEPRGVVLDPHAESKGPGQHGVVLV